MQQQHLAFYTNEKRKSVFTVQLRQHGAGGKGFQLGGGGGISKKAQLSKFLQRAPNTSPNVEYIFLVSKISWKQKF